MYCACTVYGRLLPTGSGFGRKLLGLCNLGLLLVYCHRPTAYKGVCASALMVVSHKLVLSTLVCIRCTKPPKPFQLVYPTKTTDPTIYRWVFYKDPCQNRNFFVWRKNEKMFPIINFGNVKVLRKTTFNFAVQKNLSPYILAVKIHLKNTRKN